MRIVRGALATRSGGARPVALLQLGDDHGRTGEGAASPLPGYSPDTLDDAERDLARAVAALPLELDLCLPVAPQVRRLLRAAGLAAPSAAFAFETALLDLAGHALGVPSACFLRDGWPGRPVELNALLPAGRPGEVVAAAHAWAARGFRTFKLKLGRSWEAELAAVAALRDAFGGTVTLRGDANGSFAPEAARARLDALAPFGLEFVEEPAAGAALLALGDAPVPIAADESLRDPILAERLLAARVLAAVVLKPATLGGALAALDLARRAAGCGARTVVTWLFDGPIARAAAAQLAFALEPAPLACGLAPVTAADATAWLEPPERPGLGLGAGHA